MVSFAAVQTSAEDAFVDSDPAAAVARNLQGVERVLDSVIDSHEPELVVLGQGALQGAAPRRAISDDALRAGCLEAESAAVARLATMAQERDTYIALGMYELRSSPLGYYNTTVVLGPGASKIVYRQLTRDRAARRVLAATRPDFGADVSDLLPTMQAPFGRIGCLNGADIESYEIAKALVFRGAEVLVHPVSPSPAWRRNARRQAQQARAYESVCTVVSTALADPLSAESAASAIVEPSGRVVTEAAHCGVGYAIGEVDLGDERRRRRRVSMNFPAQTRTDLYANGFAWVSSRAS